MTGDTAPGRLHDEREVRPGAVLAVTTLGLFLILVGSSSVNVALPEISRALHASTATADWFLLGFMVANTACILVFGRLSDLIGRRRIFLIGMAVYVAASVVAAVAPTAEVLIVLRVVQGIAGATTVTNSTALLTDVYPSARLAGALGVNISAAAVASTVGPTIAGVLVEAFGWQSIFLVNLPFGIASVVLGARVLPRDRRHASDGPRETFDVTGAVLSAAGFSVLLVAVSRIGTVPADDPLLVGGFVLGGALLVAFVTVEARVTHPLVDVRLVAERARAFAYSAAFCNSFARAGITVLVVLQVQVVEGAGAIAAGLVVVPLAAGMAVASPVAGRLAGRLSARTLSTAGATLCTVALAVLVPVLGTSTAWTLALLAAAGVGVALFTTPNTASIMRGVDPGRRAVANAVRSVLFNSAQALGTSITLLLVSSTGLGSYGDETTDPAVSAAFRVGLVVLTGVSGVTIVLSLLRGGGWRTAARVEAHPGSVTARGLAP